MTIFVFHKNGKADPKIHMDLQGTLNSQENGSLEPPVLLTCGSGYFCVMFCVVLSRAVLCIIGY